MAPIEGDTERPARETAPLLDEHPRRRWLPRGVTIVLALAVVVLALAAAANLVTGAVDRLNPFRDGVIQNRTVDRSGPAVLRAMNDLGEFRAASGYYEVVVDIEKDVRAVPSFLAGERTLFVAAGTVDAAVDLGALKAEDVTVDETRKTATIHLPAPRLTQPQLDLERSYVQNQQRGVVNRLRDAVSGDPDGQKELYAVANRRLSEAAVRTPELRTRAEANTRSTLTTLLTSLGFTKVEIVFDDAGD